MATLILVETYAGWKGSLPEEEVRARVEGVRQVLAAPPEEFDPTPPRLFAGATPGEFAPLMVEMAAVARRETVRLETGLMAEADQRDLLPLITAPTLLIWPSWMCAHRSASHASSSRRYRTRNSS